MFRLVVSRALVLTEVGVVIGIGMALALTRLIGSVLYKVNPRDPLAFGLAFVAMTAASLAACLLLPGAPRELIPDEPCETNFL